MSIENIIALKKRLSVFYIVNSSELNKLVEQSREIIASIDKSSSLIGKADLYPLHVTIRGIFRLKNSVDFSHLNSSLEKTISSLNMFQAITNSLINFPENSVSISFTDKDQSTFINAQKSIIECILKYQAHNIEEEYDQFLYSSKKNYRKNTQAYGEPYIGPEYTPHITIASNLSAQQYIIVKKGIQSLFHNQFKLNVSEFSLMFEENIGGRWTEIIKYPLGQ